MHSLSDAVVCVQLERIAMSPSDDAGVCSISSTDAMNLDITGQTQMTQLTQEQLEGIPIKLNMGDKERTLEKLIDDKWLLGNADTGHIAIGVRPEARLRRACNADAE
jgi:hypothetical protein